MRSTQRICWLVMLALGVAGCQRVEPVAVNSNRAIAASIFNGSKAGEEREVEGIWVCWCTPGKFIMGSPPDEPERRPDEARVEVTLTKGFWMAKRRGNSGTVEACLGKTTGRADRAAS